MQIKLDYGAYEPIRAHATDAGLDLRAMFGGCVRAVSHDRRFISEVGRRIVRMEDLTGANVHRP